MGFLWAQEGFLGQQVNVEGLRTSRAGRRASSAGCQYLQRIDFRYSGCPGRPSDIECRLPGLAVLLVLACRLPGFAAHKLCKLLASQRCRPSDTKCSSAICQQVNVEGRRASSAGCQNLQRMDSRYSGCPGMQHINVASGQQVNVEGRRSLSGGFAVPRHWPRTYRGRSWGAVALLPPGPSLQKAGVGRG